MIDHVVPCAFVIGHPISQSRSPLIHGEWLRRFAIKGQYDAVDVAPDGLVAFIDRLRAGDYVGGNVTVPHKEAVTSLADELTPVAKAIGAANTLVRRPDGSILATNTDAEGFAANLDDRLPGWRDAQTVLIVGAGGAARAVLHAVLANAPRQVSVLNRTIERAERMNDTVSAGFAAKTAIRALPLDAFPEETARADLVINTTTLGMAGKSGDAMPEWLDFSRARPGTLATDIVYVPLQTPFLAAAADHGLVTADGLGMLLHQAVPGFEAWFGRRPAVDAALRSLVMADMGLNR